MESFLTQLVQNLLSTGQDTYQPPKPQPSKQQFRVKQQPCKSQHPNPKETLSKHLSYQKIKHLSQIMVKQYIDNKNNPTVIEEMLEPTKEQVERTLEFVMGQILEKQGPKEEKMMYERALQIVGKVKQELRPIYIAPREEGEEVEKFSLKQKLKDNFKQRLLAPKQGLPLNRSHKKSTRMNAVQITMDELQTYHLTYQTKKFIPPPGEYCPFIITNIDQQIMPVTLSPAVFGISESFLRLQHTNRPEWQKIKESLMFLPLMKSAKNFHQYKNIIMSDGTFRDAFCMLSNRDHYLQKMDLIKMCAKVFIERGYGYGKVKDIYESFCKQTTYFKNYQKMMYSMNRLVIRIVQTYIIKNFDPDLQCIHHKPGLMNLECKMHYMEKHFEPSVVDTYHRILRIMFGIGKVEDNFLTTEQILNFYNDLKHLSQEMQSHKKTKAYETAKKKKMAVNVDKQVPLAKVRIHNKEAIKKMRMKQAEINGQQFVDDEEEGYTECRVKDQL